MRAGFWFRKHFFGCDQHILTRSSRTGRFKVSVGESLLFGTGARDAAVQNAQIFMQNILNEWWASKGISVATYQLDQIDLEVSWLASPLSPSRVVTT